MNAQKTSIEIEDATVESAIKRALAELKLPRNKVKIEVLSEEQKGLFGMPGARLAKVKVSSIKTNEALRAKVRGFPKRNT